MFEMNIKRFIFKRREVLFMSLCQLFAALILLYFLDTLDQLGQINSLALLFLSIILEKAVINSRS